MRRTTLALLLSLALLAGCGGSGSRVREEGPIGLAADQYWLFLPKGKPRAVVVFLHGLGESELEPDNHLPWLRHLAEQGDAVVYPRYELAPGAYGALRHTLASTQAAFRRIGASLAPVVVIGYSRGARLAVEYAAVAPAIDRAPAAVFSVFPGLLNPAAEERVDLGSIDPSTRIVILAGDRDLSVGSDGAKDLLKRLEAAGFPAARVKAVLVKSRDGFVADHAAPFRTSAAAQRALWTPADRLVEEVLGGAPGA